MSYEATKRWRERHPEAARRIGRDNQTSRRRRLGVPELKPRGSYIDSPEAQALKAKREKMAKIMEEAKKSTCKLRMKKLGMGT